MMESLSPEPDIPLLPPGTRLTQLENGLTLIVREDHSAPVVSAQVWCRAGSIDEGKWIGAGLSHMLEHMLFKGTSTRAAHRIDQEIQDAGGYMNAYTSFDRTVYWINIPDTGAKVAIDILCDIVQNASLPPEELAKEKQVILREMDMNHDDPSRRSSRRLFETAYTRSPYRYTVIGYPDIFNDVEREDLLAYYREKYSASNIFFVLVGALDGLDAERQIREAFAAAKTRPVPALVHPSEPKQTAPREIVESAPIQLGYVHFAWHIPEVRHPDVPAIDVLAVVLGSGHSSRLYQELHEQKGLVHSVDAWTYSPGNPGLFGVSAALDADKFPPARDAILQQVARICREPVSAAEMRKAVKQFITATLSARKTMQGQAHDLGGNWISAADPNFSERYLAAIKRVTAADLQRVASTYLAPDNRTIYALLPETAPVPAKPPSPDAVQIPVRKFEFPNGLRLLVKEDHRLPFVQMRAMFRGGVLIENTQNNGVTMLLAKMLLKGTRRRSAEEIVTEIESMGGQIDSYGGNNSFGANAELLNSDFNAGFDLLTDVLLDPTFPAEALERERETQLAGIRAQQDHLLHSALLSMRKRLFGSTGYGLDVAGTEESVSALRQADLTAFYKQIVRPENCVLVISGDIHADAACAAVEQRLLAWPRGSSTSATPGSTVAPATRDRVTQSRDKKQAVVIAGFLGTDLFGQDRYPLELLQESLSDLGSRLFIRIREELGLAYYVGAQNFLGIQPGYFALYAGTAPEQAALVEAELLSEVQNLRQNGITEEELHRAKAKLLGQKKISRQDTGSHAMYLGLDELYGLGYEHTEREEAAFEAVTLDQVRQVAKRYLLPDQCVVSVVMPDNGQEA